MVNNIWRTGGVSFHSFGIIFYRNFEDSCYTKHGDKCYGHKRNKKNNRET